MTSDHKFPEEIRMEKIEQTLDKSGFDSKLHKGLMTWKESIEIANSEACKGCGINPKNGGS